MLIFWHKYQIISDGKIILKFFSVSVSLEDLHSEFLIGARFGLTGFS